MPVRDKVYEKMKSFGLTDSKEDFYKYYDSDENVRKDVFRRLQEDGLTDTEEEFYSYMQPSVVNNNEPDPFDANVERAKKGEPIQRVSTQSVIDANPELGLSAPTYEYKPEVQQYILENKPDMFKPKQSLMDAPLNTSAPEGSQEKFNERVSVAVKNLNDPNIQKSRTEAEFRGLNASVDEELNSIEDQITSRTKAIRNENWRPGMPSTRDDSGLAELRGQRSYLEGAKELLEESQKIINAAKDEKDGTFIGGVLRGTRDKVFDVDTWIMGLSDLVGGLRLKNVLEKIEKDEQLSSAEEKLLDAAVTNMAVNAYFASDLGRGYKAGQVFGESIPFMLEMAINPISASGNKLAKSLLKAGMKRFGSSINNNVAKATTRLATDALAATGMAATTGMPGVLGETVDRLNKNYNYGVDANGNLYAQKTGDVSFGEALGRSFTTRALENQSEMIFRAFDGAGELLKGVNVSLPGGVNTFFDYIKNSKVGELWRGIKNSPLRKELAEATKVGGIGEEYLEEVYNNFANVALGEMSMEEALNLDNNIDTFLGLAPTQVMFSMLGLGNMAALRYKTRKDIENLRATMNESQRQALDGLLAMGTTATNQDVREFIRNTMADQSLSIDEKRNAVKAAYDVARQKAMADVQEAEIEDEVAEENADIDAKTDPQTGNYGEVNLIGVDEVGKPTTNPANVFGAKVVDGELYLLVLPEGETEKKWVRPHEYDEESHQIMPGAEVKAYNEQMIRDNAAKQAEQEAKYAPDVLNAQMQQGIPFEDETAVYVPFQATPEGNAWQVEVYNKDENGKPSKDATGVNVITNDQFRDMLQAQFEANEAAQQQQSVQEVVPTIEEETTNTPVATEEVAQTEEVQPEVVEEEVQQPQQQAPVIPTKEDGSIDFVSYGKDNTFKTLGEKYGEKMPNKVAVTAKALAEDLVKAQEKLAKAEEAYDNAPIGREQKAEQARDKAKAELESIQREADFWSSLDNEIKEAQAKRDALLNPKADIDMSEEPMNADEFIAQQLANGNITLESASYKKETGFGEKERQKFIKMFRKAENGGMTIERAGELLMQMDRENGTNFFNQDDANAGRDALINFLGSVSSWGDITGYIRNNREAQAAKETEGLRSEMEDVIEENYHMTPEEYATLQEMEATENPFEGVDIEAKDAIFAEAALEYEEYLKSLENGQGTTEEVIEGNGDVLSEEQSDNSGGTEQRQGEGLDVSEGTVQSDDAAQEESAEVEEGNTPFRQTESILEQAERIANEEARRKPLRQRAKEWEQKLGVKVNIIENFDDVSNKDAKRAIRNGQRVTGWYEESTGEVCLYMPYLESAQEIDATYIHEVVAHKGLRGLLGDKFDEFLDDVWNAMSEADKLIYLTYPGVNGNKRAAADEYIAHLAENIDVTESAWGKLAEIIKKFLKAIGIKPKMTHADIANTIKRSYQRLAESGNAENVGGEWTRFRFSKTPQEFDAIQKEAVEKKGIVMPGLNEAVLNIVDVPRHDFTGTGKDAIRKAEKWANENIAKEHIYHEGLKDEFKYIIDEDSISKFLSKSSTKGSDNLGIHLAVLKMLPEVINNSIESEIHPDYKKIKKTRSAENGIDKSDMLVHRLYGAVDIDGKVYRAKTTIHEFKNKDNKAYDYRITEVELIISGSSASNALNSSTSISAANLLNGVEKSYDKGKKLLDESGKTLFRTVYHGSAASFDKFDHSFMSTGEGNQSYGWGTYLTDVESIGKQYANIYAKNSPLAANALRWIEENDTYEDFLAQGEGKRRNWAIRHAKDFLKDLKKDGASEDVIKAYEQDLVDAENALSEEAYNRTKENMVASLNRNLYTVDIPDNDGTNYLEWDKPLSEENKKRIKDAVLNSQMYKDYAAKYGEDVSLERLNSWMNAFDAGRVYRLLQNFADVEDGTKSAKQISMLLSDAGYTGFEYPSNFMSGGNENGSKNYVIFNEDDLKIVEHTRFRVATDKNGKKTLVGLHNISENKLKKALKQGGLANPSVAVIDMDKQSHTEYGDITLVLPASMIDKKTGKNVGTYLADAYTPVYPTVVKKISDKGAKALTNALESVDEIFRSKVRSYFNSYLDSGMIYDALFYWYLSDTGKNPPILEAVLPGDFTKEEVNKVASINPNADAFFELSDEEKQETLKLYAERFYGGIESYNKHLADYKERMQDAVKDETKLAMVRKRIENNLKEIERYGYEYDYVAGYFNRAKLLAVRQSKPSEVETFTNAYNEVVKNGLKEDFGNWLIAKEEELGVEEKLFAGYDNQGRAKYFPNTLENASKLMKKEGRAGATGLGGFNYFVAILAPVAKTTKQISAKKGNLSTQEEYDKFVEEWKDYYHDLARQLQPGAGKWDDYGYHRLHEIAPMANPKAYVKKEYGIDLSDEFLKDLNDVKNAIKNDFPARYFETKFERPVYLNEVAAAVVPNDMSLDLYGQLQRMGIPMYEYERGNNEARMAVVDKVTIDNDGIRFRTLPSMKLRKLEEGEKCNVERVFTQQKLFNFSSGEKIESYEDVAYIFKSLEDEAIENTFVALIKNGKPTIVHLGMGTANQSTIDQQAVIVAIDRIKPDEVYMVHNHPSGNLKASRQDVVLLDSMKKAYGPIVKDGIIINLRSGRYSVFNEEGSYAESNPSTPSKEIPVKTYSFSKRVFDKDFDIQEHITVRGAEDVNYYAEKHGLVAALTSSQRLGDRDKISLLVIDQSGKIVGNVFLNHTDVTPSNMTAISKDVAYYTSAMSGQFAIIFGRMNIKEAGHLNMVVQRVSAGSVKVLDAISVNKDGGYVSAADEGVMEEAVDYANNNTRFRIAPQEEVQAEVDKFTSKYNGKEVVVFNSTVSDEELESLGLDVEDARNEIEGGTEGFYDPITDKIYIFADKADADTLERMLFHENGHGIFRKNKKFVEEFDKNAEGKFNSQRKQIEEAYKEHERKEEFFVRIFDHALATGDFKHLEKYLSEELWNELNDILKDFGYDRQEESDRRRIGGTVRQGNDGVLQEETSVRNGEMEPDTREESKEERRRSQEQAERLEKLFDDVADMGLRGVLGNTNYDLAMLDIFYALPEKERTDVAVRAVKIGGDVAVAVDEYLNSLEEPTLWGKVVASITNALRKVGIDVQLTENDVKYLLWRSRKPLDRNSIFDMAEDIDMRRKLKVGKFDNDPTDGGDTPGGGTRFRVTPEMDAEYSKAIESGNTKKVLKLVKDAAKAAMPNTKVVDRYGNPRIVYHGTVNEEQFNVFNKERSEGMFFFTSSEGNAREYTHKRRMLSVDPRQSGRIMPCFLNIENPLVIDANRRLWNNLSVEWSEYPVDTRQVAEYAKKNGYDGVIINKLRDHMFNNDSSYADVFIAFEPEQIKSVGVTYEKVKRWHFPWDEYDQMNVTGVTYDDNGNLIPLSERFNPEKNDIRFRAAKEQIDIADKRTEIIKKYDKELESKMFNFQEAFQDRMLSLKVLMDLIEGATGKKAKSFEDAYTAENQLGSINRPAQMKWLDEFYKPLLEELNKLSKKYGQKEIERYIYCKSGLERNEVLRQRDADETYEAAKAELDEKLAKNQIDQAQYQILLQQADDERKKTLATDTDYSGIRGLLMNTRADDLYDQYVRGVITEAKYKKEVADLKKNKEKVIKDWKQFAENQVANIEKKAAKAELDALWDKINAATNETLRIDFESGMIDRDTYNAEKKMMKYYVPLRNWENTTAEEMYEYRHDMTQAVSSNQKRAKGRKSQADNPIATIALMAQNAIVRGNRNKMKQKLYSFVANRKTSLASVRNVWYVRDANNQWEPQYADTSKAKTEAEIKQIMEQFELDMQKLEAQGDAFKGKMKQGMGYRANRKQKDEHVVTVMINGKEYGIYINGNPRAAQAVNGLTNAEGIDDAGKWIDNLKRYYGAGLTSWNPDFIIPNLVRDSIHATTMTFLDKGALSAAKYIWNTPKVFSQVFKEVSGVGINDPKLHQYFEEFVANGGETGYTAIHTLEDYKKEYDKLMNEAKGIKASMKNGLKEGISKLSSILEAANRIAEDVNRFNAYVTSREEGYDIVESVDAAKNITVNFNRKGALASNTTAFGKVASLMSRWILFFNPGVQGIYQLVTKSKLNPKRAKAIGATILASGFFMPMINELLVAAAGGDDEDDYWNLSDFKRRNNWMLFIGDGYVTIPLPPVLRELYGIGDIMYGIMTGHINPSKAIYDTLKQIQSAVGFVNLLPEVSHEPDMITYVKGFAPDVAAPILDVVTNTNFMGSPIAKWTDYNEFDPEYMRVHKGVSPVWKELSMLLNEVGGEEGLRSDVWGNFINPAMMEHLITSYTGGIGKTINNLSGMIADVVTGNKENIDLFRKTPVVPRFFTPNDEKTVQPAINRKYYDFNYEYNRYSKALKKYEKAIESGEHPEWQKYIDEMEKERIIEFINYFKAESKVLKKLQDKLKEDSQNKELERDVYDKKAEIATNSFRILRGN